MRTRERLAIELRKIAEKASPANATKYEAFAVRAATGEFDDYGGMHDCPITQLYTELKAAGFDKFAARVANGEFDGTREESDEWARGPEGVMKFRRYRVRITNNWMSPREFWTLNGATKFYCANKAAGANVFKWDGKDWRLIFGTKAPTMYQFKNK